MDAKKIYLTKEGLEKLKQEHEELTKVKRPEILDRVAQARNMGDLSENAEYTMAREELSFIDGRIDELDELLKQVVIISNNKSSTIKLGSKVMVKSGKSKDEFTLVGEWEADPKEKKISHESPLGKALLGKKVGEEVEFEAPAGKILYTIEAIN
ncbi:MAG: transcription elongation factor GreA [Candidatus Levybacteria bacterium RIFCSPLOWO2_01_FULL_39_10]|nr:MAG: transcription elongation factor GreA [Candidatus Levybacteria bacterium RIFCSPLOWO2_01_FULL_39_10]